jgi:hypothetical protein
MKTPWQYAETGNEYSHQVALFQWANMAERFGKVAANDPKSYSVAGHARTIHNEIYSPPIPQLRWLHAIKNQGHGDAIRGAKSAAEGVKAGVFDIFLPVPVGHDYATFVEGGHCYCGLYIELKRPDSKGKAAGKPRVEQLEFHTYALAAGYQAEFCYGWLEARDCLLRYLGR